MSDRTSENKTENKATITDQINSGKLVVLCNNSLIDSIDLTIKISLCDDINDSGLENDYINVCAQIALQELIYMYYGLHPLDCDESSQYCFSMEPHQKIFALEEIKEALFKKIRFEIASHHGTSPFERCSLTSGQDLPTDWEIEQAAKEFFSGK